MKRKILLIDGNYFAMRSLGIVNMGDRMNHLESKDEKANFLSALNSDLINLWKTFKPFCDSVIFVTDNKSWRKEIDPVKPYYIMDDRVIGYKEQRKEKKESSPINYDNFYELYREFIENLKLKMIVFDVKGLEGDDLLMLITNKLKDNSDVETVTFCTDGDLMQIVKTNSMLMRNIKSKDAPFGEFCLSSKKYSEIFEVDAKQSLLGNGVDTTYYRTLFQLAISGQSKVQRTLGKGISIATPFKVALVKSFCGDKKDNLFSIMGWMAKTGTTQYSLTENHVEKALKVHNLGLNETTCLKILSDKELLMNLLLTLRNNQNQEHVEIKEIAKHLKHNLRMNVLARNNVPEHYLQEFDIAWGIQESQILSGKFDDSALMTSNVNIKDGAVNVLRNSLPDLDDILK